MKFRQKYAYTGQRPFSEEDNLSFYRGYHKSFGINVVICEYKLVAAPGEDPKAKKLQMDTVASNLERVSRIEHKHITKIYEVIRADNMIVIVHEECARGSLMRFLKNELYIDQRLAAYVTKQVALGLQQLHRNGIVHGYINLENIQLDNNGNWKISAKCLILKAFYLSPEFKLKNERGKQGDIFSLGTAFYKMMFGIFPYSGKSADQIINNIRTGQRRTESILESKLQGKKIPFKILITKPIENLVLRMMKYQIEARPTIDFVISQMTQFLREDMSKSKKLPTDFESEYNLFSYCDKPSESDYASQQILTAVNKKSSDLVKVKIVGINPDDSREIEDYKKKLSEFSNDKTQEHQGLIQIKEVFETKVSLLLVYEYFNQGTLEEYLEHTKQHRKKADELFEESKSEEAITLLTQSLLGYQQLQPHAWSLKSRVYIKNGAPKLAEPILETEQVRRKLYSMRDTIDEVAPEKKKSRSPIPNQNSMDTWSLGVIYYNMLYGGNPQFDNTGVLVFPSTRTIKAPQMQRLSYYLNRNPKQRKAISELDPSKPLQFSQADQKIGSELKGATSKIKKPNPRKQSTKAGVFRHDSQIEADRTQQQEAPDRNRAEILKQKSDLMRISRINSTKKSRIQNKPQNQDKEDEDSEDDDCFQRNCIALAKCVSLQGIDESGFFDTLTQSWTRRIRFGLKIAISIIAYVLLFYMAYFAASGDLLVNRNFYESTMVTTRQNVNDIVPTVNYTLVTKNKLYFSSYYNTTLSTLKYDMNCVRDNYYEGSPYQDKTYVSSYIKSSGFVAFQIIGFLLIMIHLLFKSFQICKLDMCRLMHDIKKYQQNKYTRVISFVFTELAMASLLSVHYLLYGSLYHIVREPCLKNPALPSVQRLFSGWNGSFVLLYIWQYIGLMVAYILIIFSVFFMKKREVPSYVWVILLALYIAGLGTRGLGGFVSNQAPYDTMVSVFGVCGQLLELIVLLLCAAIDGIIWRAIRKKRRATHQGQVQVLEESNATLENNDNSEFVG